jgi:uncharacterized protein (DUF1778 family)
MAKIKSPENKRDCIVFVRVIPSELAAIKAAAAIGGEPPAAYVRRVALERARAITQGESL